MPLTMEALQNLLRGENYNFYVHPSEPRLMLSFWGNFGRYPVILSLGDQGAIFQIYSYGYLTCPATHPHFPAVTKLMATLNLDYRFVRFAWDVRDGEITVRGDTWLKDATLTTAQLLAILNNYRYAIDWEYPRLQKTQETGTDPGEPYAKELLARMEGTQPKPPEQPPPSTPTSSGSGVDVL
jgi:hypothetical protein